MEITKEMEREAANNPGGWVYKIDWEFREDQHVPPEAIEGAFKVDENGQISGEFVENGKHVPVIKAKREPREHMTRILAPHLVGQWVVEIDPDFDNHFPDVPLEGQVGRWYVGQDAKYTGDFRPNPHYSGDIRT